MTLDLLAWSPRISVPRESDDRPTIEQRFTAFHSANPHVFAELLKLARERLDEGATFISVKALWEACRVSLRARLIGEYKLNNDMTSLYGRLLIATEPRLEGVIRLRRRKHE
jgi:hypothetical protein